jgi:hypothetical protein
VTAHPALDLVLEDSDRSLARSRLDCSPAVAAGLVTRDRVAQRRPARLRGRPLADAADWLARYRQFFEESFDRLEEHLRAIHQ